MADIRIVSCEVSARRQIPARSKNDRIRPLDDPRLIPRLTPHGRLLLAPSDEGPERFPVSRTDEAYDLLDRRPQEAVQVMLTYGA